MTAIPRRPPTLPAAAGPIWKRACSHLTDAGSPPTEAQLVLVESFCRATLRLGALREAEDSVDLSTKEGQTLLRLVIAAEDHQKKLAQELKLTPRAASTQSAGPRGGRAPGTGTSAMRGQAKTDTAGADVHWLDRARTGS
jgi:hypothetical protein